MKTMRQQLRSATLATLTAIAGAAVFAGAAHSEEKKPDNEVSFNASLVSDYRYRGISQSRLRPALQGGADFTNNPSGFYAGTWLSTIKWVKDGGGDGSLEWDLYAGKRGELSGGVSYDLGLLGYIYPSNGLKPSANTWEVYGQLGYGPAYLKYSHSVTNLFGFADSKNSGYLDLGANIEAGDGYTVNLHLGRQTVRHGSQYSYTDYKLGVTRAFSFATVSFALVGTDTDAYVGAGGRNLGRTGLVLNLTKVF